MLRCAGVWRQEQGVCSKQVQQWGNARELSAHRYSTRVTLYHLLYCFSAVEQTLANMSHDYPRRTPVGDPCDDRLFVTSPQSRTLMSKRMSVADAVV